MKFENISEVMLFGGGKLLLNLAIYLSKNKFPVFVVTSQRHANENIDLGEKGTFQTLLKKNQIPYHLSDDVNNDKLVKLKITPRTLGISLGAAWIFQEKFIRLFVGKLVNVHGEQLPKNRGGGGHSWQIMQHNRLGSVIIHLVEKDIDTGNIILSHEFIYPYSCRIPAEYDEVYINQGFNLLCEFWRKITKNENFTIVSQQNSFSTYWPRLATQIHGYINWDWHLADIESFICAFDSPYPGASTFINGRKVYLKRCSVNTNDGLFHPFQTGIIYRKDKKILYVATTEGSLLLSQIVDNEGKDCLEKIKIGERFYTPYQYLEKAKQTRAFYSPKGLLIK